MCLLHVQIFRWGFIEITDIFFCFNFYFNQFNYSITHYVYILLQCMISIHFEVIMTPKGLSLLSMGSFPHEMRPPLRITLIVWHSSGVILLSWARNHVVILFIDAMPISDLWKQFHMSINFDDILIIDHIIKKK